MPVKKGFTLVELIVVLAIFASFIVLITIVMNNYLHKIQRDIELVDVMRRLTDAADKVTQILIRARGNASSIDISDTGTAVDFEILFAEKAILSQLEVVNSSLLKYTESYSGESTSLLIPIEDVEVTFQSLSDSTSVDLPIQLSVSAPNPLIQESTITMNFTIYPPGVR